MPHSPTAGTTVGSRQKTGTTMAYYDRQDIPFHYELADAFTICDAYHCSVPTSTSPNRNYWVSGYTGYEPLSPNPTESVLPSDPPGPGGRAVTNAAYNPWHAGYGWTTVPERLQSAGISWKTYQEWDNFGDNNLEYFTAFKKVAAGLLGRPSLLPYELQTLAGFYLALPSMPAPVQDAAVLALANAADQLSPADRQLYDRALYRSRPGTLAAEFRKDVESGRLPQVSYLVPSEVDSEHPSGSSPAASATLLYQVLDAIASDPDLWAKTAVIVNFDENDGYFDHVPPPRPPRSVEAEWGRQSAARSRPAGADDDHLALDCWRFRLFTSVRPHVRHAVPGEAVRNHATGNRPVATHGEWRPDVGVRLRQPA